VDPHTTLWEEAPPLLIEALNGLRLLLRTAHLLLPEALELLPPVVIKTEEEEGAEEAEEAEEEEAEEEQWVVQISMRDITISNQEARQ